MPAVPGLLPSKEKPNPAEERIRVRAGRVTVDYLLVRRLQRDLGRREHGDAGGVELGLAGAGRRVEVGAGEAAGLRVLEGVAVERHRLPVARQDVAERQV